MDIIRMIIDRDCHVSSTNRQVIKHVISRLKNGYATFKALPRDERRKLMNHCIKIQRENFKFYCEVMKG